MSLVLADRKAANEGRSASLDLHEGICDPRRGCGRWPEGAYLLNEATGELLCGRCKATNLCPYCQRLYVVETVEMLTLDAMNDAPSLWLVLTAREHLTRADTYSHLRQIRRAVRRRWPDAEWFVQVEFQRRGALHLNLLVKGVPVADVEQLRAVVVGRWCARVDAEPVGQWVEEVGHGLAVTRYISKMLAHGLKREQAPPIGWKGHRTSQTRGYFSEGAAVARERARESLRSKRRLWRAIGQAEQLVGEAPTVDLVELVAEQLEVQERGASWRLVHVKPGSVVEAATPGVPDAPGESKSRGRAPTDPGPTVTA